MDAVDFQTLQKFAETPFVIEAPVTASAYAAKAAAILGGARIKVHPEGSAPKAYTNALDGVRKQVATEFKGVGGRIEFLNLAEKDLEKEVRRIDRSLANASDFVAETVASRGAFAFGIKDSARRPVCIVVGPHPDMTAQDFFAGFIEEAVEAHGVDDEAMQRTIMWHELGHCLLGVSENKADTFAALMTIRHLNNPNIIPLLASWREYDEWTRPEWSGDYFISKTLWSLQKIESKLRHSAKFMSMSVREIASLAEEVAAQFGPSKAEIEHRRRFRGALAAIHGLKAHYVPARGGVKKVDVDEWMSSHADNVPEFRRLQSLKNNLQFGAIALQPFEVEASRFRNAMKKIAKTGDRSALAFLNRYEKPWRAKERPDAGPAPSIGFKPKPTGAIDEIIAMDRASERIDFSMNNDVWVVRDRASGSIRRAGSISLGREWGAKGYDPLAARRAAFKF